MATRVDVPIRCPNCGFYLRYEDVLSESCANCGRTFEVEDEQKESLSR